MAKVTEIQAFFQEHDGTHAQVVAKLTALDWQVEEELPDRTVLIHDLLPGARRIVHQ